MALSGKGDSVEGLAAVESTGEYPVLVIPGYGAPFFQTEWVARQLRSAGLDTVELKLPWMAMGNMTRSAEIVAEQAARLREARGFEKINLFGYSLGGLIARYYLQEMEGYPMLGRGAFVSTPHYGTYIGYFGFFSTAGRQVRPGSRFIRELNETAPLDARAGRCLSIFVRWDGVIVPSESSYFPYWYNLMRPRPLSHWRAVMNSDLMLCASEFLGGGLPDGAMPGHELGMVEAGDLFAVPASLRPGRGRRVWRVVLGPFRSFGTRVASIFHRRG
jgi:pimeloyl-ACP methyl ester carboxylesterase